MKMFVFEKMCRKIMEDITTGSAGIGGSGEGSDRLKSSDSYNPGDQRFPYYLGTLSRRGKVKRKKKEKK